MSESRFSYYDSRFVSTGRRLNPLGESIDHPTDMPLRRWNRKKPRHQRDTTVTHNSVFAALHRLNAGWRLHLTIRHFFFTSEDSLRRRGDSRQTGPALSLSRTGFQPVGAKRESTSKDAHR